MVSTAPALAMTLEAWGKLGEDAPGEFVAGRLEEEEVPDLVHEAAVAWLIAVLKAWLAGRGGFVFGSEAKFAVAEGRGRKPDVSVFFPGHASLPRRGIVKTPPDIMVEVLSDGPADVRRDRVEKPDEYAAFGVRYYWLLDPESRTLEMFELGPNGRYVRALAASAGQVQASGCKGLTLDLDDLWSEVERLEG